MAGSPLCAVNMALTFNDSFIYIYHYIISEENFLWPYH